MTSNLFRISIASRQYDHVARYAAAEKKRLAQAQRRRVYLLGHNLHAIGKLNITHAQLVANRVQIATLIDEGVILLQNLGVPGAPIVSVDSVLGPAPKVEKPGVPDDSPNTFPEVLPPPSDPYVDPVSADVPDYLEEPVQPEVLEVPGRDTLFLSDSVSANDVLAVEELDLHALLVGGEHKRATLWAICDQFTPPLLKATKTDKVLETILEALDAGAEYDAAATRVLLEA